MTEFNPLAFTEIPVKIPEAVAEPPPSIPRKVLEFDTERQEQTNWCWAAVTLAVSRYYAKQGGGEARPQTALPQTQAEIVNTTFDEFGESHPDCCKDGSAAPCNRPYYVYKSLAMVHHYEDKHKGHPGYDAAKDEIDADRPLIALVKWNGGGAHFLTVRGYDASPSEDTQDALLHLGDPWYGESMVSFGSFPTAYQAGGSWTYAYRTRPLPTGPDAEGDA